jgi:hypothetical protein
MERYEGSDGYAYALAYALCVMRYALCAPLESQTSPFVVARRDTLFSYPLFYYKI